MKSIMTSMNGGVPSAGRLKSMMMEVAEGSLTVGVVGEPGRSGGGREGGGRERGREGEGK